MKQLILAGVGGQGIVLASRILSQTAIDGGQDVLASETIGMAQRGGSVVAHLRIADGGEKLFSPMISDASADAILAFEPGEALRSLTFLKPGGIVVTSNEAVFPTMTSDKEVVYDVAGILSQLEGLRDSGRIGKLVVVDTASLCEKAGSHRAINTVMLGALMATGCMELDNADVAAAMAKLVKPKFVELNQNAMRIAYDAVSASL